MGGSGRALVGVETLKRWVAESAEHEPHWSLVTPLRPAVPDHQDEFALGPLDGSILAGHGFLDLTRGLRCEKRQAGSYEQRSEWVGPDL